MSRTRPDRFERLGLGRRCPTCWAKSGEWCITRGWSYYAQVLHVRRYRDLIEAFWAGYDEAKATYTTQGGSDDRTE